MKHVLPSFLFAAMLGLTACDQQSVAPASPASAATQSSALYQLCYGAPYSFRIYDACPTTDGGLVTIAWPRGTGGTATPVDRCLISLQSASGTYAFIDVPRLMWTSSNDMQGTWKTPSFLPDGNYTVNVSGEGYPLDVYGQTLFQGPVTLTNGLPLTETEAVDFKLSRGGVTGQVYWPTNRFGFSSDQVRIAFKEVGQPRYYIYPAPGPTSSAQNYGLVPNTGSLVVDLSLIPAMTPSQKTYQVIVEQPAGSAFGPIAAGPVPPFIGASTFVY